MSCFRTVASLAAALLAWGAAQGTRAGHPPDAAPVLLIKDATIYTVTHGTIERGFILTKDGKIAEVGQSIKAPRTLR